MKHRTLLIALAIAGLVATSAIAADSTAVKPTAPTMHRLDWAKAIAAGMDIPIIIDFYADWCTWCKKLDTEVYTDPKVIDFFSNEAVLVKVNGDKTDTALARQYCVSAYPTLIMIDKDGKEIDRVAGYLATDEFLKTFRDFKNGIGTIADMVTKASGSTNRDTMMQIAERYKYGCDKASAVTWYDKVIAAGKPTDSLAGESRMALADMFRRAKKYDSAVLAYQKIAKDFKKTPVASDANWYVGDVYRRAKDTVNAIKAFEGWIKMYPKADSEQVNYTKGIIEKLKGTAAAKPADAKK